jgi:tRNA modification GTPase
VVGGGVLVSALTGEGIDGLRSRIEQYLLSERPADAADLVVTSVRQRDALVNAAARLRASSGGLRAGTPDEIVLLDLHAALDAIGELTGEVTTDDILDRVFSTFCIGK